MVADAKDKAQEERLLELQGTERYSRHTRTYVVCCFGARDDLLAQSVGRSILWLLDSVGRFSERHCLGADLK